MRLEWPEENRDVHLLSLENDVIKDTGQYQIIFKRIIG